MVLDLGGAALQRCGNWLVFTAGFSRRAQIPAQKELFPQPVKPALISRRNALLNAGSPTKTIRSEADVLRKQVQFFSTPGHRSIVL